MSATDADADSPDAYSPDAYSPEEHRPLAGYVVLTTAHLALAGGGLGLALRRGKLPERLPVGDLALGAVATYKLSKMLAHSSVTSPLRAPFTQYVGPAGPAEVDEEVRGRGLRKAVGELLTCPFCLGHWIATAFAFGLVFAPRTTRFASSILAVEAAAEQFQFFNARHDEA